MSKLSGKEAEVMLQDTILLARKIVAGNHPAKWTMAKGLLAIAHSVYEQAKEQK